MGILGKHKRIFIAGTDTSVGKTYFACQWIRFLVKNGVRVGVMKPIETGISRENLSDGYLLKKASRSKLPIDQISPYRFKTPVAPRIASSLEKKRISIPHIVRLYHRLAMDHEWMIVEGAGGLMVPILKGFYMIDLIKSLNIGVVLVASERLGTINHTLLSVSQAHAHGLKVLAIILNHRRLSDHPAKETNAKIIHECIHLPVLSYFKKLTPAENKGFWEGLLE